MQAMNWFPENVRQVGRFASTWDAMIQHLCKHKQIGTRRKRAQEPLWEALRQQNISHQLIWTLQCFYHNQTGDVHHGAGDSRKCDTGGMDLGDDMFHLFDLRFADDVLTFANTKESINQSNKPACPWAAHLGAGDPRKPTSYVQGLYKHQRPPQTHNVDHFQRLQN